jgi:hypothetical protein
MHKIFDLLKAIEDEVERFVCRTHVAPAFVAVSPAGYEYLVSLAALEGRLGNLVIGCAPVRKVKTPHGGIELVIDEMLEDEAVSVFASSEDNENHTKR